MSSGSDRSSSVQMSQDQSGLVYSSPQGRWVILASVLGSGMAFLDSTVVNVALPAIGRDLGGGLSSLQWILDGYLVTLAALLLLGGALGDRYGRRKIFVIGLVVFSLASAGCGLASSAAGLIGARIVQGIGGALLVPGSLALINSSMRPQDRGRAVGAWAGLAGVTSAIGPLLGGWLVDTASWRWVFFLNLPLAAVAVILTMRHVPESRDVTEAGDPDIAGAVLVTVGLGAVVYALIEVPARGWGVFTVATVVVGAVALVGFPVVEARRHEPMLPLEVFRSAQFTGANVTTLAVYAGLGGALFLLALQLQQSLRYSALAAGLALLPITVIMLVLSARMGVLAQRIGPWLPMSIGPLVAAGGLALMARVEPGAGYAGTVLPAVAVFGLGLAITVAPLTSTVLAAVPERHVGAASGINNAVARLASLLAVAVLPLAAGVHGGGSAGALGPGYPQAMLIAAAVCAAGGLVAALTVRNGATVRSHTQPAITHGCQHPCTSQPAQQEQAA